jgi:hypothetical protein
VRAFPSGAADVPCPLKIPFLNSPTYFEPEGKDKVPKPSKFPFLNEPTYLPPSGVAQDVKSQLRTPASLQEIASFLMLRPIFSCYLL